MSRPITIKARRAFPASITETAGYDIEFRFRSNPFNTTVDFCFRDGVYEPSPLWNSLNDPNFTDEHPDDSELKEVSEEDAWAWLEHNMRKHGIDWSNAKERLYPKTLTLLCILKENRSAKGLPTAI